MKSAFDFKNVSFAWPGGHEVLKNQSFSLCTGTFTVVRGLSGAGKSTLLRLMNRLEEPQSGVIYYRGCPLPEFDPPRLRQQVAYLQQMPAVPDITVRDLLLLPLSFAVNKGMPLPSDEELSMRLDELLLGGVGLKDHAAALSVGQRQRLCLARALITGPETLLLDEPTASLDKKSTAVVEQMAEKLCNNGTTIVMVTHDGFSPRDVPMKEIHMEDGKVNV